MPCPMMLFLALGVKCGWCCCLGYEAWKRGVGVGGGAGGWEVGGRGKGFGKSWGVWKRGIVEGG